MVFISFQEKEEICHYIAKGIHINIFFVCVGIVLQIIYVHYKKDHMCVHKS